ncbi:MAG: hypothetical protein R3C02_13505 [Planctomycetaceae bacterium]
MEDFDVQARWFREVPSDNLNRWTIVTHHHPVFSVSKGRDNPEFRCVVPVYDEFKVDLVLAGTRLVMTRTDFATFIECDSGQHHDFRFRTLKTSPVSGPSNMANAQCRLTGGPKTQPYQIITLMVVAPSIGVTQLRAGTRSP